MSRLAQKVAMVTGASSGIGRAIALAYAREGASVAIVDTSAKSRDESEVRTGRTHELIRSQGGYAEFYRTDVTDRNSVEDTVHNVSRRWGRLDILVNNAGKANLGPAVWETPDDDFDSVCSVNVRGPFMCTRAAIRQMLCQSPHPCGSRGWIVNVASVVGLIAMSHGASYTTSKHAVLGLTKAAACDAAPHHIHVNAICPGYITTKLTKEVFDGAPEEKSRVGSLHPLRRQLGEPSDITGLAIFLASEEAKWITGAEFKVDGGYSMV